MPRRKCTVVYYSWKGRNPPKQITRALAAKIVGETKLKRAHTRACRQGETSVRPLSGAKHYSDGVAVVKADRYNRPL